MLKSFLGDFFKTISPSFSRLAFSEKTSVPGSLRGGRHLLAVCLLSVTVLACYANSLQVPFVFDDVPNISDNLTVQIKDLSPTQLKELIRENYGNSIRVFAYLTFALNYYFGGLHVFGYHLVNLLIHLSAGLLLYAFLILTFKLPSLKKYDGPTAFYIALLSSLIFLSHPIQTQSVTYIVQRMASMGGMLYLLCFVLYIRGRLTSGSARYLWWAGMVLSYLLGVFTKENVAILPLFVALYEFYFFQNLEVTRQGKKSLAYGCGAVVLIGLLILLVWGERYYDVTLEGYKIRDFTLTERVLTQFRVVLFYLTLLVYPAPSRLNLDYDFPVSKGILDPWTTLGSIVIIAILLGYSLWTAKRKPLVSYFILWYFGNLLIESSFFPLEMVFEHRLYLPMVSAAVLFAAGVVKGGQWCTERWGMMKAEKYLLAAFCCCLIVSLAVTTYQRNRVWGSRISLWRDVMSKSPNKARPNNNLGSALIDANRPDEAIPFLERAISIKPDYADPYYNLGNIFLVHREDYNAAISLFTKAITLRPGFSDAYINLAGAYNQMGRYDETVRLLTRVSATIAGRIGGHFNLCVAYASIGNMKAATRELEIIRRMDPKKGQELEDAMRQFQVRGSWK